MRTKDKLAKAKQVLIVSFLVSVVLVQGVYGIHLAASGGGNGESGYVALNFDLAKDATLNSQIAIEGAAITPATAIRGPVSKFEETHAVKDSTGKSASVSVNVMNAPNGLTYQSYVLPGEGTVTAQPWVSAEQWLTVPKADSIKATESASYGTLSGSAGIDVVKGSSLGDYVTLTDYYGKAYASATQVSALQTAAAGSAKSIRVYGQASDGSTSLSIETPISGLSGSVASFTGLDASSLAGISTQVTQKEHVMGTFTSTSKSGTQTKTRTSNYGTEYDLNMRAKKVGISSTATGTLGYYVNINNPSASKIQSAVNAAKSGDWINVAEGTYKENIGVDKSLTINGAGLSRSIVDGNKIGSVFKIGLTNSNIDVTLSGLGITGGSGTNGNGGGIVNAGRLSISESRIYKNSANYGAGIYNRGTATITGSTISGNKAGQDGGGIDSVGTSAKLAVSESNIIGNSAKYGGGGIFNALGTATVTGSVISGNSAKYGGGIDNVGASAQLTVSGSKISGNSAKGTGSGDDSYGFGAGIYNGGTATITDSTISNNWASGDGGGILNPEDSSGTSAKLTVSGSNIIGNTAVVAGGGIFNALGTATVTGSVISENSAKFGGGIDNEGPFAMLAVSDSKISGNSATYGGGTYNGGRTSITDSMISENSATADGGAIYSIAHESGYPAQLTVSGSKILGNSAACGGGGIFNSLGTSTVIGSVISGNSAKYGGGIDNAGASSLLTVSGSTISGNSATYGGGIFNGGTATICGTTQITNNQATTAYGGGIYSGNSQIRLDGTKVFVESNKAHLPSLSGSTWYKGLGVFLATGAPTTTNGFNPVTQVIGNIRI